MPDNNKIYITLDGLQKLKDQLKYLINIERKNIAEHIQEAKELGDLSENAEYSAAKDEQAFLEMKIAELDSAIKNAVVIEENGNSGNGIVGVGSTVKFKVEADNKKECTIVGCHESDPLNNKISNESPIGRAFLGHKKGDTVEFQAPKGLVRYKILDIK